MIVIRNTSDWASCFGERASEEIGGGCLDRRRRARGRCHSPFLNGAQPEPQPPTFAEVLIDELPGAVAREQDAVGQNFEMIAGVDEPRQGDDPALRAKGVGQAMAVRVRARQRHEVVLAEDVPSVCTAIARITSGKVIRRSRSSGRTWRPE